MVYVVILNNNESYQRYIILNLRIDYFKKQHL